MASVRTQQGHRDMLKNLIISCCLLLLWFFSDAVLAASEENTSEQTSFSSLWLTSQDGSETFPTEVLSTEINMSVSGPILRAKVKQTFRNTSQMWLEGRYSFPLPEQAAVDQLRMIIGERVVEGQIKEKQAAKKSYETARANGQRASLLNHHRTNIFTTSVANIGPKEKIIVEFEYQQVLDFQDHQYNLRFPMVSTPQYTPASTQLDNDFVAPITALRPSNSAPGNPISITVDLQPGFPIEPPLSISHPVSVNDLGKEHYQVDLTGSAELSNRDFILSWKLKPSSKPMVSILREDISGQSYGLMMVMPPQASTETAVSIPRELILVLDVSGSMQGESIEQARSAMLKALSKLKPEEGIWMTEVEKPEMGHNDLLIRIKKTAICGTDVHIYNWDEWSQKTIPVPMVVGHEYVGEVVGIGQEVRGFNIGDRVSGEGHITCGHCRNCRGGRTHLCRNTTGVGVNRTGAFSEFLVIPAFNAFKIPAGISDDLASIFDPFGNAVHTALSFDLVGEDVLITGAGPIGIMAAAVAKHVGARHVVITDVNEYRLDLAKKMGVTRAVNVMNEKLEDVMSDLGMTEGFDVGLEMSGVPSAFNSMLTNMNHGGKISLLGIPPSDMAVDWNQVIFKGLVIKGIYGREMFETWYKMASLIQSGLDLTPIITHHYKIDDFQAGFDMMRSGMSGKVILDWE